MSTSDETPVLKPLVWTHFLGNEMILYTLSPFALALLDAGLKILGLVPSLFSIAIWMLAEMILLCLSFFPFVPRTVPAVRGSIGFQASCDKMVSPLVSFLSPQSHPITG